MKIQLEFFEFILLQRIASNRLSISCESRSRDDLRRLQEFRDAGLITQYPLQPFDAHGPICISPLGQKVLREHTPYIDPLNKAGAIFTNYGVRYGLAK